MCLKIILLQSCEQKCFKNLYHSYVMLMINKYKYVVPSTKTNHDPSIRMQVLTTFVKLPS